MQSFDNNPNISQIKEKAYNQGVEEGTIKSNNDSMTSGFKAGVTSGVDHGYNLSFIETLKSFIDRDIINLPQQKSKLLKIQCLIETVNKDNIDILKTRVKQIKTNLKLIYHKD